jgi:hypothetical protein
MQTLAEQSKWDEADSSIAALDTKLVSMRNRFSDRSNVLRG